MHALLYHVQRRDGLRLRGEHAVRHVRLRAGMRSIHDAAACSSRADTHVESNNIAPRAVVRLLRVTAHLS